MFLTKSILTTYLMFAVHVLIAGLNHKVHCSCMWSKNQQVVFAYQNEPMFLQSISNLRSSILPIGPVPIYILWKLLYIIERIDVGFDIIRSLQNSHVFLSTRMFRYQ